MKQIKSITLLMMVFLTLALTGPTTARAAAITADGRQEIVAGFIAMLGRSPSPTELAEAVVARENGETFAQVMSKLTTATEFSARYPGYMTADEFAEKLTATLLGDSTPASTKEWAMNWAATQLQNGKSYTQIIAEAVQNLRATTNTNYSAAKEELAVKVSSALTNIDNPAPAATSKTAPGAGTNASDTGNILKDLMDIAEDLKIEEEDGSDYFKGGLKLATDKVTELESKLAAAPESERAALQNQLTQARTDLDTLSKTPSETYKKLQALETELKSATTDAQRQAVVQKLTEIQKTLTPWLLSAATNSSQPPDDEEREKMQALQAKLGSAKTEEEQKAVLEEIDTFNKSVQTKRAAQAEKTRQLTETGLTNLRAINDRVLTNLTGGGKSCRTRYNSNTHVYETVCD